MHSLISVKLLHGRETDVRFATKSPPAAQQTRILETAGGRTRRLQFVILQICIGCIVRRHEAVLRNRSGESHRHAEASPIDWRAIAFPDPPKRHGKAISEKVRFLP